MGQSRRIAGYDPGGNGKHGVAVLTIGDSGGVQAEFATVQNVEEAIDWLTKSGPLCAIGLDTLTVLSTGDSGWRPADRWLRAKYPAVANSVVAPNALRGSMALSGLVIARLLRDANPDLVVVESHPKVLYYQATGQKYEIAAGQLAMDQFLSDRLSIPVQTKTDDEGDAVLSAFAGLQLLTGTWTRDLHSLPTDQNESLVSLIGPSKFVWPE